MKLQHRVALIAAPSLVFALAAGSAAARGPQESEKATAAQTLALDGTASAEITAEELAAHVKGLSSDELKGRSMGTPESLRAAELCAETFERMGLEPGAEDGTYLQRIPFGRTVFESAPELVCTMASGEEVTLFNGEDFRFQSASLVRDAGPLRCVTVAEEEQIPEKADPEVALIFGTSAGKARRWLKAAGHDRGAGFGAVVVPRRGKPGERSVPRTSPMRPITSPVGGLNLSLVGTIGDAAREGQLASIHFKSNATHETADDANVVAVLPGTEGEARAGEFVVLSAHRDHIGLARSRGGPEPAEGEDVVNNGADDDASGCAAVLEIAEALAMGQGDGPRRTVVVILVTGEEAGMIGSKHWVAHPTVPLDKVVCALNFEMLGRPDPMVGGAGNIWLTGDDRSDLGPHLRETGEIDVSADPRLEMNFFVRSDNVSFARAGIVSQTLSSFGGHKDYHRVTDEWDTLDYEHMETATRACLRAVELLVSSEWTPSWNEGEPRF